ncbi:amino acid adenylation domain-containing protein [Photobacterium sp. 53610]|uniref:amino acid adenylation domain-containing protein n=1 Tax=Photobacterium sp. 53610 TaxID=3102789 RepID=UPI002ED98174
MARTVLDGFYQQLSENKYKTAVVYQNQQLTFQQLHEFSDQLCYFLKAKGVRAGQMLPIIAQRTPNLIIGILAVMKAGASYIPVDASYPQRRIQDILEQVNATVVLTTNLFSELTSDFVPYCFINIETAKEMMSQEHGKSDISPDDLAYIIFTSGTTGSPKGVMIPHSALQNVVAWHNTHFDMTAAVRMPWIAGISFDVSQWEIWSALTSGTTLFIPEPAIRQQPDQLLQFFADQQITHAFVPTVYIEAIVSQPQPEHLVLRYLFTAGEKLSPVDLSGVNYTLIDYYGPTEATIFATCQQVPCRSLQQPESIGRPIAGAEVFILDTDQQEVKAGQSGELCIAGPGLAAGYLNAPGLTAEKFVRLPRVSDQRLYRSGDRARMLPDGRIQYLGRLDDQVKIRGNRIELGELEGVIKELEEVKQAVALVAHAGNPALKKILVFLLADTKESPALIALVRQQIDKSLPEYFQPAAIVPVMHFPLTSNGKIDKQQLLNQYLAQLEQAEANTSHLSEAEAQIAAIWCELLGNRTFLSGDAFLDVGGDSLQAVQLATLISNRLGVQTYVRDIYDFPTLQQLAHAMARRAGATPSEVDSEPVRELHQDVKLPSDVQINPTFELKQITAPQSILLTGATGFVGSHLLAELLRTTASQIVCLVRATSAETAMARLLSVLTQYRIELTEPQRRRIQAVAGDLAEPDFSMDSEQYQAFCQQVDLVYHSASAVNFIQPYSYMRHDNVQGLKEVIRFASSVRTKPLILLSTVSVYSWGHLFTGKTVMYEADDIDQNLPAVAKDIGYVRSKWVMEKVADLAAAQGLPLMTFRLGYATTHSQTGVTADYQWWGRLVKTCLKTGCVPDLRDFHEGLTTVDYMAAVIAHISRNPEALSLKFNLVHEATNNLKLPEFFRRLGKACGTDFQVLPYRSWLALWESEPGMPLYPLLSMFKDRVYQGQSTVELYQKTYQWDCRNVKCFLQGSHIQEPVFNQALLRRYLEQSIRAETADLSLA